jgi:hypothetical protein
MMFQRLNETDPERIFMSVKNSYSTATLTVGQWAAFDIVTDKDGVAVTKPAGHNRVSIAGVVIESIAHNAHGKAQVWGWRDDVMCVGGSGSVTSKLTAGAGLKFATSGFNAQCFARNSAALKSKHGKRQIGYVIEPTFTAGRALSATAAKFTVMITCL